MTDAALVLRARGGDELAFRRLLDRYEGAVKMVAREQFLKGADAADLHQEIRWGFAKAVRDWRDGAGSSFTNFALMCMRRQAVTAIKTADRAKHGPLNDALSFHMPVADEDATLADYLPAPDDDPADQCERRADVRLLQHTIEGLTEVERAAVLGIAEGFTYEEIVERAGGDMKRIDNAAQRGKRKLAAALEAAA